MWYHITIFFNANETGPALALVATSTALSQVIGAPIGAALMLMDGLRDIRGWRWLFLIEGLITIVFGIAFYVSPSTADLHAAGMKIFMRIVLVAYALCANCWGCQSYIVESVSVKAFVVSACSLAWHRRP